MNKLSEELLLPSLVVDKTEEVQDDSSSEEEIEAVEETVEEEAEEDDVPPHDEVEMLLEGTAVERMQIIASDPKYYLNLVDTYTKTRDDRDIYLPNLFNILVRREGEKLRIKFKMNDNGDWHEVGYDGDTFNDEDVYAAFRRKVAEVIKNPYLRRAGIENTMGSGDVDQLKATIKQENTKPIVSQGNQNTQSKIDVFLGRTDTNENVHRLETPPQRVQFEEEKPLQRTTCNTQDDLLREVVTSFKNQLAERLHHEVNVKNTGLVAKLDRLQELCPENKKKQLRMVTTLMRDTRPFSRSMLNLLPEATESERCLLLHVLCSDEETMSHAELCDKLALSDIDRKLCASYNIDLTRL